MIVAARTDPSKRSDLVTHLTTAENLDCTSHQRHTSIRKNSSKLGIALAFGMDRGTVVLKRGKYLLFGPARG